MSEAFCQPACVAACPLHIAVIIPTVSSTSTCFSETASTLKFAHRAKQIKNQAVKNEDVSQSAVEMAAELARLRQEVAMLRSLAGSGKAGGDELQQALSLNAQLEDGQKRLKEQVGRLRE
jgi:kinesin family protein 15